MNVLVSDISKFYSATKVFVNTMIIQPNKKLSFDKGTIVS